MAKIKFGMMMTDARGKLGGQVFSKNRAGAYIRTKVTPSNPQTRAQSAVRSNLGTLSTAWNLLTAAQITGWNTAVNDWQTTDIFGDVKKPTGKNLFVKLGLNCLNNGMAINETAPEKMELPAINDIEVTLNDVTGVLTIEGLPVFTSGMYQIEATPPVPLGVSFVKNKFRVIESIAQATATDVDVTTNYQATFGSAIGAQKIYFRIRAIGANGQAGTPIVILAELD